jgi:hypothetical protein
MYRRTTKVLILISSKKVNLRYFVLSHIVVPHFVKETQRSLKVSDFFADRNHRVVMERVLSDSSLIHPFPNSHRRLYLTAPCKVGNDCGHCLAGIKDRPMLLASLFQLTVDVGATLTDPIRKGANVHAHEHLASAAKIVHSVRPSAIKRSAPSASAIWCAACVASVSVTEQSTFLVAAFEVIQRLRGQVGSLFSTRDNESFTMIWCDTLTLIGAFVSLGLVSKQGCCVEAIINNW